MNHIVVNRNFTLATMVPGRVVETLGGSIKVRQRGWFAPRRVMTDVCRTQLRRCSVCLTLPSPQPPPAITRLQFSAKGADRFVATVGSSVLPAAKAKAAIPVGISSVVVLYGVLLPAGVKPAPKPPAPPPLRKAPPPRPKRGGGGGSIGGGNPSVNYYLGCFADGQFGARTLPTVLISGGSNLTRLTCAQAASAADLPYFGLQGGNTCYGGSNLAMAQSQGVSTSCTAPCTGDANQICGGTGATTLWSFEKASAPTPTCDDDSCYLPLGCFAEPLCNGGSQGMAQKLTPKQICKKGPFNIKICFPALPSASVPLCANLAKAYNYRFFSLQNGVDCYGSNGTAYAMSRGLSTACTKTCANAAGTTCGGSCANAIYQVGGAGGWGTATPASPTCLEPPAFSGQHRSGASTAGALLR